jgi:hypothetical protein
MQKLTKFDVDEALDSIDLRFTGYAPSVDSLKFFNYIRVFVGQDFEIDTPLWHYFLVDLLLGKVKREDFPYSDEVKRKIHVDPTAIAILAARGTAKSTITTLFYPIYASILGSTPVTGPLSHMLILSDSQQGGSVSQARILASTFEKSKFAKEWFESMRFTDTEAELVRRDTSGKGIPIEKRHMLIKFKGVSTGGIRSGSRNPVTGDRYAIVAADDIIKNEEDAYSEALMDKVKTALESDAENAMRSKNTQMIIINTPFHKEDPIYKIVEGGAYTPLVVPICKEITLDTKKEDFVGVWEESHSYEAVMKRWRKAVANNSTRAFNQELMLRVSNESDRMITDDMIQWYDRNLLLKMLDSYNLYITTDFTTTSAASSDFSSIVVWAVSHNDDWFLVDLNLKRLELVDQYAAVFRLIQLYSKGGKHIEVGVEVDGQQKAHIYSLKEQMLRKGQYFSFARQKGAPVGREGILSKGGGGSKLERFRYVLPMFQNRKIYFPEQLKDTADMKEAIKQIKGATHVGFTAKDDFCDTVSQIAMIDYALPAYTESAEIKYDGHLDNHGNITWVDNSEENYRGSTVF